MKTNIFNPFTRIAGTKAFLAGFTGIILGGILCYLSKTHFDGVIDVHFGNTGTIFLYLAEGLIDVSCALLFFSFAGLIISGTRFRFIDILGTISFARLPLIIVPILALVLPHEKVIDYFLYTFFNQGEAVSITTWDIAGFIILSLVMMFVTIWSIALMYNAFRICTNTKVAKTVIAFVIALILAEVLSKIIFYIMNPINIPLK